MGPQFFQTRMGQRYYEVTAPKIATEFARLADNVAALNETLTRLVDVPGSCGAKPAKRCIKCGAVVADPQLQGDERGAQCGDQRARD